MKNLIYINILFFILLILITFLKIYYSENEAFTPYLRKMYRPYIRKARITTEGLYVKHGTNFQNILRKFGII